MDKVELLGKGVSEIEEFMSEMGEPRYRGRQVHKWINQKTASSFAEMTDLSQTLRKRLEEVASLSLPVILKQRTSLDGTRKYLLQLFDGQEIECVAIPQGGHHSSRHTLCISTQVGCPLGCRFCATGKLGFRRNLKAYEIAGQVLAVRRELEREAGETGQDRIGNVVYMGMGEPLLNYNEVIKSVYILNDPQGLNIGQRHITLSTAGDVTGIERLAREMMQVTLAVSLHACDDELRSRLMPINRKYPLAMLMGAVKGYVARTGRRVTFEYILLAGINDRRQDAENMAGLIGSLLANINLIPYNGVEDLPYCQPEAARVELFCRWLQKNGLNATVRQERGADIEAACGQLRAAREITL
ncbi:MAG TPA: 23S rRNA (adenine(2503)-C(2))-methyltransferase RlmN [Syntrophomonadaceae bacterium]|nr:23S rRNA (adenine(2503)-C(2))-methyltransferase RlmN [Syntrophomonadaceae bacterium]